MREKGKEEEGDRGGDGETEKRRDREKCREEEGHGKREVGRHGKREVGRQRGSLCHYDFHDLRLCLWKFPGRIFFQLLYQV